MIRPALNDKQIARMSWRTERFKRYGVPEHQAETLADMLADRDWSRDERRLCLECSEYGRDGSCLPARQGRMKYAAKHFQPMRDTLQRCEHFKWALPA
jgi:hypothetical protein